MESRTTTRAPHVPPVRHPRYGFGAVLKVRDLAGRVDAVYADYWAALDSFVIPEGWFEKQEHPPSTKDQVFYSLIALDGNGSIVAGEQECEFISAGVLGDEE